jgi:hypothetical protein
MLINEHKLDTVPAFKGLIVSLFKHKHLKLYVAWLRPTGFDRPDRPVKARDTGFGSKR